MRLLGIQRRTGAALALMLGLSGCMIFGAGAALGAGAGAIAADETPDSSARSASEIPAGAAIKVTLTPPRDIAGSRREGKDSTWLRNAQTLIGRVATTRSDTIQLLVTEVRLGSGRTEGFRRGSMMVAIPRAPDAAIQVISLRPDRTEKMLVGAGLGFAAAVLTIVVICSLEPCLN